jgi:aspartyl-tRNA(Asn)/glutamyl-tRNA(Gln) amidotransferase subunit B
VLNQKAVQLGVRAALALGCGIQERSQFARKQYFYPDLPKGYQISQFEAPFSTRGELEIEVDGVRRIAGITRVHLEEDAGKNVHGQAGSSVVDLNRAGTPLVEIVGDPDLRNSDEATAYLKAMRDILVCLGVNDGNLEEGSFRCDVNVSVRPVGTQTFGTRVELKNINSFRFVHKAIECEIERQVELIESGKKVVQETRSYDPERNVTKPLRSKADAHDYRYFPDPDLPPLVIDQAWVAAEKSVQPELPTARRARYQGLGVAESAAQTLTSHPRIAEYFDACLALFPNAARVSNWILTEVLRGTKVHGLQAEFPVSPEQLAELVQFVERGDISGKQAKDVYAEIEGTSEMPTAVVERKGLRVVSDSSALLPVCQKVLADNGKGVAQYRSGKTGTLGFFVGQVMRATGGSADPQIVSDMLKRLLDEPS